MRLLGKKDLLDRWVYTRQGVHNVTKGHDFPAPYLSVNKGQLLAWRESDIEVHESDHPELQDVQLKLAKTRSKSRNASEETKKPLSNATYLGGADLRARWCYSRASIHGILKSPSFAEPSFVFNQGNGRVWHLEDVILHEVQFPELIDLEKKATKIRRNAYMWSRREDCI
ncbi:MAG: hypothetical protein ABJG15_08190 [Hyphomonadaceae bacterium]